jgi:hypothetical protein
VDVDDTHKNTHICIPETGPKFIFDSRAGQSGCPPGLQRGMSAPTQKITFGEMRASGVCWLLIYCSDFRCSHWTERKQSKSGGFSHEIPSENIAVNADELLLMVAEPQQRRKHQRLIIPLASRGPHAHEGTDRH